MTFVSHVSSVMGRLKSLFIPLFVLKRKILDFLGAVCVSVYCLLLKLLNHLTDFHEALFECYAFQGCTKAFPVIHHVENCKLMRWE